MNGKPTNVALAITAPSKLRNGSPLAGTSSAVVTSARIKFGRRTEGGRHEGMYAASMGMYRHDEHKYWCRVVGILHSLTPSDLPISAPPPLFYVFVNETSHRGSLCFSFYFTFLCLFQSLPQ